MPLPTNKLTRALRRPLRRIHIRLSHWFLSGPPVKFFFEKQRQRLSVRKQEKQNFAIISNRFPGLANRPLEVLYLHIPKCGGTSISRALLSSAGFKLLSDSGPVVQPMLSTRWISTHYDIDWFVRTGLLSRTRLEDSFTFTIVRNPFERAVSLFHYLKKIRRMNPAWNLETFLEHINREQPVIGGCKVARFSQAAPQISWISQSEWNGFTSILRLEEMASWKPMLETQLGTELQIPHVNRSRETPTHLSGRAKEMILAYYSADFERFAYSKKWP